MDLPHLLGRIRGGDEGAQGELTPTLYDELRQIAARHLRNERSNHTLQATALVNEAFVKLLGSSEREYADQVHFLAIASRVMRQVLVDYARSRSAQKRGSDAVGQLWTASVMAAEEKGLDIVDLIQLDGALTALALEDQNLAQLIEMRYFGGMTAEESAAALGKSPHVVRYDLRLAQAWLRRRLSK